MYFDVFTEYCLEWDFYKIYIFIFIISKFSLTLHFSLNTLSNEITVNLFFLLLFFFFLLCSASRPLVIGKWCEFFSLVPEFTDESQEYEVRAKIMCTVKNK